MSIALYYNSDIRNNGTAVLCWDALKRGLEQSDLIRYSRPGPDKTIESREHALHIMIDDGRDDIDWTPPKPNAFWAIDTHLGYDRRLEWGKRFDHVFTAQKSGAAQMLKDGIKSAHWLPLACHPSAHPNLMEMMNHPAKDDLCAGKDLSKQYDLAFVGFMQNATGPGYHNRTEYLDAMFKAFSNSWLSVNMFFEQMAVRYLRARLGFNISIRDDLNMRWFEILSTGTAMLANRDQTGWDELGFVEGQHFIGYSGIDEAKEQAGRYLKDPDEREAIAKAGHELARAQHTYAHRMQALLDVCDYKD